jgi:hypothetical protein
MVLFSVGVPLCRVGAWSQQLRQLGDVGRDPPCLVINLSVHLRIPVPILPREMDMRAPIARWFALIAMLGLLALVIATGKPCVPYGQ